LSGKAPTFKIEKCPNKILKNVLLDSFHVKGPVITCRQSFHLYSVPLIKDFFFNQQTQKPRQLQVNFLKPLYHETRPVTKNHIFCYIFIKYRCLKRGHWKGDPVSLITYKEDILSVLVVLAFEVLSFRLNEQEAQILS